MSSTTAASMQRAIESYLKRDGSPLTSSERATVMGETQTRQLIAAPTSSTPTPSSTTSVQRTRTAGSMMEERRLMAAQQGDSAGAVELEALQSGDERAREIVDSIVRELSLDTTTPMKDQLSTAQPPVFFAMRGVLYAADHEVLCADRVRKPCSIRFGARMYYLGVLLYGLAYEWKSMLLALVMSTITMLAGLGLYIVSYCGGPHAAQKIMSLDCCEPDVGCAWLSIHMETKQDDSGTEPICRIDFADHAVGASAAYIEAIPLFAVVGAAVCIVFVLILGVMLWCFANDDSPPEGRTKDPDETSCAQIHWFFNMLMAPAIVLFVFIIVGLALLLHLPALMQVPLAKVNEDTQELGLVEARCMSPSGNSTAIATRCDKTVHDIFESGVCSADTTTVFTYLAIVGTVAHLAYMLYRFMALRPMLRRDRTTLRNRLSRSGQLHARALGAQGGPGHRV